MVLNQFVKFDDPKNYKDIDNESRNLSHSNCRYNQVKQIELENNKIINTPFMWVGLSIIEKIDLQEQAFLKAKIEGTLSNAYDLLYQDKKGQRAELIRRLQAHNLLSKCDSGGFQLMKNGQNEKKPLTPEIVFKKQKEINSDILIQLDVPLGVGLNDKEKYARIDKTIENYKTLKKLNKDESPIMPVFHGHDIEMLAYGIQKIKEIQGEIPIAGIGSLVPMLKSVEGSGSSGNKWTFIYLLLKIREMLPDSFIHAFGVSGTMAYLAVQCGIDSYDSNSWIQKSAQGVIQLPGISDRFLFKKPHGRPYLQRNRKLRSGVVVDEIEMFMKCKCDACKAYFKENWNQSDWEKKRDDFDRNDVESRQLRSIHNLSIYQNELNLMRKNINEGTIDKFCMKRLRNGIHYKLSEAVWKYKRGILKEIKGPLNN